MSDPKPNKWYESLAVWFLFGGAAAFWTPLLFNAGRVTIKAMNGECP